MSINSPTSLSGIDRQLLADRVYDDSAEANSARWKLFLSQDEAPVGGLPFDATKLQARARQRSPSAHYGSVTHFTDWIFGLYGKSKKSEALLRGLAAEALIYKARVPVPTAEGWRLIGDVPPSGVSHQPGQAEIHKLSVALPPAESAQYR